MNPWKYQLLHGRPNKAPFLLALKFIPVVQEELSEIVVESLEGITNEWQAHFWCVFTG